MNILTAKVILRGQALSDMQDQVKRESTFFNQLKAEGKTNYHRHPSKVNGKWYIEQLVRNTNGTFSTTKVLVHKIKASKFIEQTSQLLSDSIGNQLAALGFKPSV